MNYVMMSYIALLELGGDKTREKVKSLNIDAEFKRLVQGPKATKPKKSMTAEEKLTKGLLQTYLTLAGKNPGLNTSILLVFCFIVTLRCV